MGQIVGSDESKYALPMHNEKSYGNVQGLGSERKERW